MCVECVVLVVVVKCFCSFKKVLLFCRLCVSFVLFVFCVGREIYLKKQSIKFPYEFFDEKTKSL